MKKRTLRNRTPSAAGIALLSACMAIGCATPSRIAGAADAGAEGGLTLDDPSDHPPDLPAPLPTGAADPGEVSISVHPKSETVVLGEPLPVEIRIRNDSAVALFVRASQEPWECQLTVRHTRSGELLQTWGAADSNPYPVRQVLRKGEQLTVRTLTQACAVFPSPGMYEIAYAIGPHKAAPVRVRVVDYDRATRSKQLQQLVQALRAKDAVVTALPFDDRVTAVGREEVLRLMAHLGWPEAMDVLLDEMEGGTVRQHAYAEQGLVAMPEPAAVLSRLRERMRDPSRSIEGLLEMYTTVSAREDAARCFEDEACIERRRRELRMEVALDLIEKLKSDRSFAHTKQVPWLIGVLPRQRDRLIEYLLRSAADISVLRTCATALREANLQRHHVPMLELLLDRGDVQVADAAMLQLVRLDRARFLPVVEREATVDKPRVSEAVIKAILE